MPHRRLSRERSSRVETTEWPRVDWTAPGRLVSSRPLRGLLNQQGGRLVVRAFQALLDDRTWLWLADERWWASVSQVMTSLLWLRRDLRRTDHPALVEAVDRGPVLPLFVIDPRLWASAGGVRRAWMAANLRALSDAYAGRLTLRVGEPTVVLPRVAEEVQATSVHISAEPSPFGHHRDRRVADRLGVELVATGSPYAVTPGRVRKADGSSYQVFTPWSRAWREHGWPSPAPNPEVEFSELRSDPTAWAMVDAAIQEAPIPLPPAGEQAALERWAEVLPRLSTYDVDRDRPDLDGTSRLSPYLKVGAIHPRTLLADLDLRIPGHRVFATELAWRDFYADVLASHPSSTWSDLRPLALDYDDNPEGQAQWQQGRTGFPIVDAGMRQLAAIGWMHNRVRMIVASFFCKDLHLWWPAGARWFLDHLLDGDVASNSHGWQWTAGTGTDAAPYFRVFNPTTQGERYDPTGDYVRRWVPELRHLPGKRVHQPWRELNGYAHGYPEPMVDHAEERRESLRRYAAARQP